MIFLDLLGQSPSGPRNGQLDWGVGACGEASTFQPAAARPGPASTRQASVDATGNVSRNSSSAAVASSDQRRSSALPAGLNRVRVGLFFWCKAACARRRRTSPSEREQMPGCWSPSCRFPLIPPLARGSAAATISPAPATR